MTEPIRSIIGTPATIFRTADPCLPTPVPCSCPESILPELAAPLFEERHESAVHDGPLRGASPLRPKR